MERSFHLLSALYGIVGLLLLRIELPARGVFRSAPRLLAAIALAAAILAFPSGLMERGYLQALVRRHGGDMSQVAEIREGALQTIIYLRSEVDGETTSFRLLTDGYSMSGTGDQGQRYMSLFVYWAVAMRPDPKRALLISYGAGVTASALTATESLEHIDVVDISRAIVESSETLYPNPEEHPLQDPRTRVHIEDGRYFLKTTKQSYDLITGEPPPPKIAGVVSLYTREYFQLVYDRLNPGGVNTYWLPAHNLTEDDSKAIIRAYCDVFSDCALWSGVHLDWMLTGSRHLANAPSEEKFTRQWRDATVGRRLRDIGIDSPELMGSLFIAGPAELRQITLGTAPLTDDFPKRIGNEFADDATNKRYARWVDTDLTRQRFAESPYIARMWPPGLRERTLEQFDFQRMLIEALDFNVPLNPMRDLHRVLSETRYRYLALKLLGQDDHSLRAIDRLVESGAPEARYPIPLGSGALANRDYAAAARHFQASLDRRPRDERTFFLNLYALCMSDDLERARQAAAQASLRFGALSERGRAVRDWFQHAFGIEF
jgi:spermidine synthase